jgi:hypothetical protein
VRAAARGRGELLTSPTFAASVGLLLLNDHVLKAAWPGWVTGKLSDVAGVGMIAIVLIVALRRIRPALAVTAVAFAALKTVPTVAAWAAPVLGGVTRTDPTDLLALLVLPPVGRWAARQPSVDHRNDWRLPLQILAVGAAVFATTATSCAPGGVWDLAVVDGVAYARAHDVTWESRDGGASWARGRVDLSDLGFVAPPGADRCAGDRCFRLARGRAVGAGVFEVVDGEPVELLTWSDAASDELADAVNWSCFRGELDDLEVVAADDDIHVVVSMTEAGTLRWSAATSTWQWVAVGGWGLEGDSLAGIPIAVEAAGPDFFESTWPGRALLVVTFFGAAVSTVFVGRLARRRGREPSGYVAGVVAITIVALVPLVALPALLDEWRSGAGRDLLVAAVVWALIVGGTIGTVAAMAARPRRALRPPRPGEQVG